MSTLAVKYNSKVLNALLARNVELHLAKRIISEGYNLSTLKLSSTEQLESLGLTQETIKIISEENRPPISNETVIKLLYESKFTCCVCRDPSKGIIIHHIDEWHKSKSHDESNLVVLCSNHHDLAHTQKSLTLQLSPERLIGFKTQWLKAVAYQDSQTILGLIGPYSRWDYINQNRIFECFLNMKINPTAFETYEILKAHGIINLQGLVNPLKQWEGDHPPKNFITDIGRLQIHFTYYLRQIVEAIIEKTAIIDITNNLNRGEIKALVKPGVFISAQLGFYFREEEIYKEFESQRKTAYYRGNKVRIHFSFNAWECTSSSGRFDHMTAKKIITPILFVNSVIEQDGWIDISTSCLAAGSYFNEHRLSTSF
jgi:hypothetical protein